MGPAAVLAAAALTVPAPAAEDVRVPLQATATEPLPARIVQRRVEATRAGFVRVALACSLTAGAGCISKISAPRIIDIVLGPGANRTVAFPLSRTQRRSLRRGKTVRLTVTLDGGRVGLTVYR
jgi:hypothetical protein